MTYIETIDLLDYINSCYPNFDTKDEAKINSWADILQPYDKDEVKRALNDAMGEDKFQYNPPQVQYLIRNLIAKYDKVDYSKLVIYCPICGRPLNQNDYEKHFDRCSSVEYVIRETKKWYGKDLSKRKLFEMTDDDFKIEYLKLLSFIKKNTTNLDEKLRIEFVFNSPNEEETKKYFEKKGI